MLVGLLLGAAGAATLPLITVDSGYGALLPVLLGLGMGLLTPAAVAAALHAGPPDRPGLSSGVNNTARQAAGALGVAVFGAILQAPEHTSRFVGGLHAIGWIAAALWLAAVGLTLRAIPPLEP